MTNTPIFKVLKPGLQTTIQDLGRFGYQQYGISPSGAMDTYAMQTANILTGNHLEEAVLEASLIGPTLEALADIVISICGGDFSPVVDGRAIPLWKSIFIKKGQVLTLGSAKQGARCYISVAGEINVPIVLHSKSTYLSGEFGGFAGRALEKGDILLGRPIIKKPLKKLDTSLIPRYEGQIQVRVILGPHEHRFSQESINSFLTEEFIITPQANRMGYQLKGPKLQQIDNPDIISDPIPLGGIQVPASGQPIILLSDRQTTGGYTRIGTVISVDIPLLAQAVPGTCVTFKEISIEDAQSEHVKRWRLLKHLALFSQK
jgi:antagonist of KipI